MAITSGGTLGTGASASSSSSYTFNTATNTLASGDFAILVSVFDNTSTSDGDNNENTSVSGGTGTWTKMAEYVNSNGAADAGVGVAIWKFEASGSVGTGTTITLNFTSNRTNKCCSFWKFTKGSGKTITLSTADVNPVSSGSDNHSHFGGLALMSGIGVRFPAVDVLMFRGLSKEANTTTAITATGGFTAITGERSQNDANAVIVRGEFIISQNDSETSNPTISVSGDVATIFIAMEEIDAPAVKQGSGVGTITLGGVGAGQAGTLTKIGEMTMNNYAAYSVSGTTIGSRTVNTAMALTVSAGVSSGSRTINTYLDTYVSSLANP